MTESESNRAAIPAESIQDATADVERLQRLLVRVGRGEADAEQARESLQEFWEAHGPTLTQAASLLTDEVRRQTLDELYEWRAQLARQLPPRLLASAVGSQLKLERVTEVAQRAPEMSTETVKRTIKRADGLGTTVGTAADATRAGVKAVMAAKRPASRRGEADDEPADDDAADVGLGAHAASSVASVRGSERATSTAVHEGAVAGLSFTVTNGASSRRCTTSPSAERRREPGGLST